MCIFFFFFFFLHGTVSTCDVKAFSHHRLGGHGHQGPLPSNTMPQCYSIA
eukprot:NODE_6172_length_524_cov_535.466951.p2 GENE.NODE_6172_length_524_cov_535.466951~~NODE_6172_length_524_cov_535.466951.p2  ORF type:complete len:59 (+),score=51.93 NODE_6172_length_524_cov_535.466951:28-177(+)